MEFRVLGPLDVVAEGGAVLLGPPKQRAVLAALLLSGGAVVSRDRLREAVWGEEAPPTADRALQVYVHGLRRVLGTARIETQGAGYRLVLEHDELDVERFDRLVERGRQAGPAEAAEHLSRALSLWRGEPLADLAGEPIARLEAGPLEERRLAAEELWHDAQLALGRHVEIVPSLARLLEEHPFRERLHEQHLLALYRAGRQHDALAAYRELRRRFDTELGVEPGPRLQELERRILNHDPALEAPAAAHVEPRLPAPPTSLLGRGLEVAAVAALLRREEVRLLTLTGPGGTGKTRVALAAAAELAPDFGGAVVFVDLSAVREGSFVLPAIAEAAGVPGGEPAHEHLRARRALLVLDNLEQLGTDVLPVAELLAAAPLSKLLATSRTPLRLSAEHMYPVPALPLEDAAALFAARARAADPHFAGDEERVAEICLRLDCLPLAVELAAARVNVLSLDEIDARLELLGGGVLDAPARQQTLRATLDWSYELLDERARTLLAGLSVFAGPADRAAIADVCGDDRLEPLVESGLVRRLEDGRFALLATIREYAQERLDAETRRRHAQHMLGVAERAAAGDPGLLLALAAHHDDLRTALAWAAGAGDAETEVRLAVALRQFWMLRGELDEARAFFASAIEHATEPALRIQALVNGGVFPYRQGDLAESQALFEEALALARATGDDGEAARCVAELGAVAAGGGDLGRAASLYEEAAELFRAQGQEARLAMSLANLGAIASMRHEAESAAAYAAEAVELHRRVGDRDGEAIALHNLARSQLALGDVDAARSSLADSLAVAVELGYREVIAYCLGGAAELAVAAGDAEGAARLLGASAATFEAIGVSVGADELEAQERVRCAVVGALGEAGAVAAVAAGAAAPLDDVLPLAGLAYGDLS